MPMRQLTHIYIYMRFAIIYFRLYLSGFAAYHQSVFTEQSASFRRHISIDHQTMNGILKVTAIPDVFSTSPGRIVFQIFEDGTLDNRLPQVMPRYISLYFR